jgi:hypothetical protein
MRQKEINVMLFPLLLITALFSLAAAAEKEAQTEYYHVVGNKVDRQTFLGWNLYNDTCVGCHGAGATGTSMAPDLTVSVARMSPMEFKTKVLKRYLIDVPTEEIRSDDRTALRRALIAEIEKQKARESGGTVMPRWEHNPIVRERVQYIYRYLKARADGVLGPDRPELLKE